MRAETLAVLANDTFPKTIACHTEYSCSCLIHTLVNELIKYFCEI